MPGGWSSIGRWQQSPRRSRKRWRQTTLAPKFFFCESGKRKLKKYYFGDTPWLVNRGAHGPWHLIVTRLLWSQIWAAWMKSWPLRIKTWRRHPLRGGYGITSSELCKNEEEMKFINCYSDIWTDFFVKCHSKILDWNTTNLMLPPTWCCLLPIELPLQNVGKADSKSLTDTQGTCNTKAAEFKVGRKDKRDFCWETNPAEAWSWVIPGAGLHARKGARGAENFGVKLIAFFSSTQDWCFWCTEADVANLYEPTQQVFAFCNASSISCKWMQVRKWPGHEVWCSDPAEGRKIASEGLMSYVGFGWQIWSLIIGHFVMTVSILECICHKLKPLDWDHFPHKTHFFGLWVQVLNRIHTGRVKITPLQATGVRTAKPASFIQMRSSWIGDIKGDERADRKDFFLKMSGLSKYIYIFLSNVMYVKIWNNRV